MEFERDEYFPSYNGAKFLNFFSSSRTAKPRPRRICWLPLGYRSRQKPLISVPVPSVSSQNSKKRPDNSGVPAAESVFNHRANARFLFSAS